MADIDLNAELITHVVAYLGALNWGLQETADLNLVTEVLGADSSGLGFMAFGLAGAVALLERFEVTEIFEDN